MPTGGQVLKRVNVAGFGLIGKERAKAIGKLRAAGHPVELGLIFDPYLEHGLVEFEGMPIRSVRDWPHLLDDQSDLLILACPHDLATKYACAALEAGKSVLLEKPMGRSLEEARRILSAASRPNQLSVGFNYRYMPGIRAVLKDVRERRFGDLISVCMEMGHGGRPGDEVTWKLDPVRCGGGALLDPGIHLLDLIGLIADETLNVCFATAWKGFWNTGIEENVHVLLKSGHVVFNLHVSIVRWRSTFEVTVHGTDGYGVVLGRGRSYGAQTYTRGERWGWRSGRTQAESEDLVLTTDCEDRFSDELATILGFAPDLEVLNCDARSALASMELYDKIRKYFDY